MKEQIINLLKEYGKAEANLMSDALCEQLTDEIILICKKNVDLR